VELTGGERAGQFGNVMRAAGFQQNGETVVTELFHQRQGIFLEQRFAAREFHKRETQNLIKHRASSPVIDAAPPATASAVCRCGKPLKRLGNRFRSRCHRAEARR